MKGAERRMMIFQTLKTAGKPISGSSFAKQFGVSRQVIVQDIALLRAEGNDIVITGVKQLRGGVRLPDYNDHRMVMLAAIAAADAEQPVTVEGTNALNKSWPEFLNVYQQLGGKAE